MMNTLLPLALQEYGITEHKGAAHHPRILEYFRTINKSYITTDETAWCSAYVNFIAKTGGYEYSGELTARSWLTMGKSVKQHPTLGDVVVFWREAPKSWKGHVGFFIGYSDDTKLIYVLGGNQNNSVCIKGYPTNRLLDIRRLSLHSKSTLCL